MVAAMMLEVASSKVILSMSFLVMPIDLKTPICYWVSLRLASIERTSLKKARTASMPMMLEKKILKAKKLFWLSFLSAWTSIIMNSLALKWF